MFVKLRFYYRARDSAQNGVQVEKVPSTCKERCKVKPRQILYQKQAYLRVKKESGDQREYTCTNLVAILKIITPLDPRNSKNSKRIVYLV